MLTIATVPTTSQRGCRSCCIARVFWRAGISFAVLAARAASIRPSGPSTCAEPPGPGGNDWTVEAPEQHGLTMASVKAGASHVFDDVKSIQERNCFLVVKDGTLIYEEYRPNEYKDKAHEAYSMTKTMGALVAGWAYTHKGLDIDADITKKYGVPSPKPYPVTSRQIMSQALSGNDGPGEKWEYDASGVKWINTMAEVVRKATGMQVEDIWKTEFQKPLGLSNVFTWPYPDKNWASGSKGTCRDYARIGQLLLNKGIWTNPSEPIVSPDYVQEMHTPQTRYEPYKNYSNPCYGLLTWLNTNPGGDRGNPKYPGICPKVPKRGYFPEGAPTDVFLAVGVHGQDIMVVPDHNMVVVTMGNAQDDFPVAPTLYEAVCKMFPNDCVATRSSTNTSNTCATEPGDRQVTEPAVRQVIAPRGRQVTEPQDLLVTVRIMSRFSANRSQA